MPQFHGACNTFLQCTVHGAANESSPPLPKASPKLDKGQWHMGQHGGCHHGCQSGIWPRPAAVFQTGIQCKMTISLLLLQPTLLRLGGSPTTFVVEAPGCACSSKLNLISTFQKSNAKTASTVEPSYSHINWACVHASFTSVDKSM